MPYSQVISKVTQEQAPKDGWEIAGVEPMRTIAPLLCFLITGAAA